MNFFPRLAPILKKRNSRSITLHLIYIRQQETSIHTRPHAQYEIQLDFVLTKKWDLSNFKLWDLTNLVTDEICWVSREIYRISGHYHALSQHSPSLQHSHTPCSAHSPPAPASRHKAAVGLRKRVNCLPDIYLFIYICAKMDYMSISFLSFCALVDLLVTIRWIILCTIFFLVFSCISILVWQSLNKNLQVRITTKYKATGS